MAINIKPENKGKFTAKAKRHDMGVQEFANKVMANKEDYTTSTVKQANFARNSKTWKHQKGGEMQGFERTKGALSTLASNGVKTLKALGNDIYNRVDQSAYTKDSTNYRDNIQPLIYPGSKKYIPPKGDLGERISDSGLPNYNESIEVIERLKRTPYRPKYKEYFK